MPTNIFSIYSTPENRVTASILAVLQSLSLNRIERLLGALLEQPEFELVQFRNQPSKGGKGIPDAEIASSVRILLETKIKRNAVKTVQIKRHLKRLDKIGELNRVLLVLTPDDHRPSAFMDELENDERLAWASFASLDQAIEELLNDPREVVSEREAFLLRELQVMLEREKLIGDADDVVVVPARRAWDVYQRYRAYICQPERSFRSVRHIAFYSQNQICPLVPRILETHDRVELQHGIKGRLGKLVDDLLSDSANSRRRKGHINKIMLLSPPNSPETVELERPIVNDMRSDSGRLVAFTQNQRYVSLERLKRAKTTSDLVNTG